MKSLFTIFAASLLATSLGCVHLQPIGPMADAFAPTPTPTNPAPGVTVTPPKDAPAGPVLQTPPPPPTPAILITPGEVAPGNEKGALGRLEEELRSDRRSMESMPRYAEVSVISGRR